MKAILAAALTASVLSFGFVSTGAYAQNAVNGTSSSKDKIHQKMANKCKGHKKAMMAKCRMM